MPLHHTPTPKYYQLHRSGGANLQASKLWAGNQGWQGIGQKLVRRQTGVQWVTTVAGSGRQTKLQADRGEAIREDIEHVRAREGEGLGGILEWGDRDTREINEDE